MEYAESKAIRRLNAFVLLKLAEKLSFELIYNYLAFFLDIIIPEVKQFIRIKNAKMQNGKKYS